MHTIQFKIYIFNFFEFRLILLDRITNVILTFSLNLNNSSSARTTKMAYMDRQPKPPRSVKRAQAKHGTHTGELVPRAPCSTASRRPRHDDDGESTGGGGGSRRDYSDGGALGRNARAERRGKRGCQ